LFEISLVEYWLILTLRITSGGSREKTNLKQHVRYYAYNTENVSHLHIMEVKILHVSPLVVHEFALVAISFLSNKEI